MSLGAFGGVEGRDVPLARGRDGRADRLGRAAARGVAELLEGRRLLSAAVVGVTAAPSVVVGGSPLAPIPGKTFWVNGTGGTDPWQFASSITPNTTNDLVLNVSPFASLYTVCCEGGNASPGNTGQAGKLLTNGLTQNQVGAFPSTGAVAATGSGLISDASSGANVLSDLADPSWWMAFNLGAQPGATPSANGYDISEIDVITGHQDFRTGQNTDIMVQFVGATDWISLSAGRNFNFERDPNGTTLDRGAAQMAVVNTGGGAIVSNVKSVKFVAGNSGTWYRELVVTGTVSGALAGPGPSVATSVTAVNDANDPTNVALSWHNGAAGAGTNASEYQVQRAPVVNGVTGAFTTVGAVLGTPVGVDGAYIDPRPDPGTYVYRVIGFNSYNGGTFSAAAQSGVVSVRLVPRVVSINRTNPAGPGTNAGSVTFSVTFNQSVTGVDATDFAVAGTGGVSASGPLVVGGSGAVYTVTVNGISGAGTLGLNLVDNGSIHDPGRTLSFQGQQAVGAGSHPRSVALMDVNGDGKPDLLVTNFVGDSVSVLLGNGDGTFGAQQTYAIGTGGSYAMNMVVTDVSGDGRPDVVVANDAFIGTVGVLLGNANGTFAAQQTFAAGQGPYSVAVQDVNGDGKLDLEVINGLLSGTASVLLGNGDGTFGARRTFAVGAYPRGVAVADVTGDGKQDLVVANYGTNNLSILAGNGNGTFGAQQTIGAGSYLQSVVASDVSGDGKPDLIVVNYGANTLSVLVGNGNGTFQGRRVVNAGPGPFGVAVTDVNLDGKKDLVVANAGGATGNVGVLLGNGNGTFQVQQTLAAGVAPASVAVMDLNGNGKPDLVVANQNDDTLGVLLDNPSLNFVGQAYTIVENLTINGTGGADSIALTRDADQAHVDWSVGTTTGQILIADVNGLTINGNGGNDAITLNYVNGNPLPAGLHLNGTFLVSGLAGTNPLAGTTLDVGRSAVTITYPGLAADPIANIKAYLVNGYAGGTWAGAATASTGAITSLVAKNDPSHATGVGYIDAADGTGLNPTASSILLKFAVIGDTDLDGTVGLVDFTAVVRNFGVGTNWDQGVVTYGASVSLVDYTAVVRNFGVSPAVTPGGVAATSSAVSAGASVVNSGDATVVSETAFKSKRGWRRGR